MKRYLSLLIIILIFSCNKKPEKHIKATFYYPNREIFKKFENSPKLNFKIFRTTDDLLDSLTILNYEDRKSIFHIEDSLATYYLIPSYLGHPEGPPPMIRERNIIGLSQDSIFKSNSTYTIDSLYNILKKDLGNFGDDPLYSDSPENIHILLYDSINKLKTPLIKLFKTINQINSKTKDSLELKIVFSNHLMQMKILEKEIESIKNNE